MHKLIMVLWGSVTSISCLLPHDIMMIMNLNIAGGVQLKNNNTNINGEWCGPYYFFLLITKYILLLEV